MSQWPRSIAFVLQHNEASRDFAVAGDFLLYYLSASLQCCTFEMPNKYTTMTTSLANCFSSKAADKYRRTVLVYYIQWTQAGAGLSVHVWNVLLLVTLKITNYHFTSVPKSPQKSERMSRFFHKLSNLFRTIYHCLRYNIEKSTCNLLKNFTH